MFKWCVARRIGAEPIAASREWVVPACGVIVHAGSGWAPSNARAANPATKAFSLLRSDVRSAHWNKPRTARRTSERSMAMTAFAKYAGRSPKSRLESRTGIGAEEYARVVTSLK